MDIKIYINDEETPVGLPIAKRGGGTPNGHPINQWKNLCFAIDSRVELKYNPVRLSVRTSTCLDRAGIETYRDLISRTPSELLRLRFFGRKSLTEVEKYLEVFGLALNKNK